ncbi:MAG TPA: DUF3015 family protein [Nitrospiraceae bacterium]|nr:DUF3015 family protein [Nitrospiraceae bacterium]
MKHYLAAMAIMAACALPSSLHAAAGTMEGGPGCGLGAMLWADSTSKKHILQQSSIATTNLTGFQTFAITSATSGCTNDGVVARNETIDVFVGANFDDLLQDMAQGSGEHLTALATLLGIPTHLHPPFFLLSQEHYPLLLPHDNASPIALLRHLYEAMEAHPLLKKTLEAA